MSNGTFKLSNQALGAVMMALQESLLNELDIVPILKGFELTQGDEGLVVTNPPTVANTNSRWICYYKPLVSLCQLKALQDWNDVQFV